MNVFALFISPTKNTKKVTRAIATGIASVLSEDDFFSIDLTPKDARRTVYDFGPEDIVIIGVPTYAGRIPNKLMPYIKDSIYGDNTKAISVVTYGNRAYDNSLKELYYLMNDGGFLVTAACSAPCEHAFTDKLATNRPTQNDIDELKNFGKKIGKKIADNQSSILTDADIPGQKLDEMKYYIPKKEYNTAANFLKAMPITDPRSCINCGNCRTICPMDCYKNSPTAPEGVCIKCYGCIKACPTNAKTITDADFQSHVKYLENNFSTQKHEIEFFIG